MLTRSVTVALLTAFAPAALADIVALGGAAVIALPPDDITLDAWESSTEARAWFERDFVLSAALDLDVVNSGLVQDATNVVEGQVPAGVAISTYMLRVDPVGGAAVQYTGYVTFDRPILGVLIHRGTLNGSDAALGAPTVSHYNKNTNRGVDLADDDDSLESSADRRTVTFLYTAGNYTDDMRIVVSSCLADLAADGLVDFSDYLEFLNLYEVQDPRIDFNQDGLVDFGDYLEFLNHYDAGC
ncbi:MAG: hypothetical protein IT436_13225 [Phycisphaerales bacterium]|nr:hypothetical protein [Phycisphaerales bacterium]